MKMLQRALIPQFLLCPPKFDVAEREGEECVKRASEELSVEAEVGGYAVCATRNDSDEVDTNFVDNMGGMDKEVESEWFTYGDNLQRANFFSKILLEGVVNTSELPSCSSSIFTLISIFNVRTILWPCKFSSS